MVGTALWSVRQVAPRPRFFERRPQRVARGGGAIPHVPAGMRAAGKGRCCACDGGVGVGVRVGHVAVRGHVRTALVPCLQAYVRKYVCEAGMGMWLLYGSHIRYPLPQPLAHTPCLVVTRRGHPCAVAQVYEATTMDLGAQLRAWKKQQGEEGQGGGPSKAPTPHMLPSASDLATVSWWLAITQLLAIFVSAASASATAAAEPCCTACRGFVCRPRCFARASRRIHLPCASTGYLLPRGFHHQRACTAPNVYRIKRVQHPTCTLCLPQHCAPSPFTAPPLPVPQ